MMRKTLIIIAFMFSMPAFADIDSERQNLHRIMREIDFLIGEIKTIKADAPGNTRIKFEYNLLSSDLLKIRHGISDHINGSLDASRPIEPIHGIYKR